MPIDMNSKSTLIVLAILYGLTKALGKWVEGGDASAVATFFFAGALVGTLVTMALVWLVLAVLGKWHLHTVVTNWIMLVGSCLAIISSLILGAA